MLLAITDEGEGENNNNGGWQGWCLAGTHQVHTPTLIYPPTPDDTAPAPMPMSNCSLDGSWVQPAYQEKNKGPSTNTNDHTHPPAMSSCL